MKQHRNNSRRSGLIVLILVLILALTLTGCSISNPAAQHLTEDGTSVNIESLSTEYKLGFFDYVKLPFSYLLSWLYDLTGNFGVALILFALIVKILLLPASAKSKKGMMKMSRLTPQVKALEEKYGDDKQAYQAAVNELYRKEGASGCGGCIWSLLPLLILIPLYEIIREPITWLMFHGRVSDATLGQIQNALISSGSMTAKALSSGRSAAYWQMSAMPYIQTNLEAMKAISPSIIAMNTKLLGVELATIPHVLFWNYFAVSGVWNAIGQFLLPILSGGINMVSVLIGQKQNNAVVVDKNGNQDEEMAKSSQQAQSNKMMTYLMPLMSVYIGFVAPAGLSVYWIVQGVFGMVQDYFLNKHYKQIYDAEDEIKRQNAAKEAALEAERERLRAERRAENPDGMVGAASKKKLQQRQKNEQAAKEAAYQEMKAAASGMTDAEGASEDPDDSRRPNRRGRNYDPHRYDD
ncbi:MAG: YidC/Oxa1 family membrane protein insertase [Candidatus Faecousia sp.]|nr:YidC/Oxa1 family membrane protein insertase [Candidatus Faecousia sp.]